MYNVSFLIELWTKDYIYKIYALLLPRDDSEINSDSDLMTVSQIVIMNRMAIESILQKEFFCVCCWAWGSLV